jgi:signal transduction histidine kinase
LADIPRLVEETRRSGVRIDFEMRVDGAAAAPGPLGRDAYRIVQEALTNVLRHAHAEAVQIACAVDKGVLTIEIEDDGAGFEPRTVSRPRASGQGLGLLGMRERLSLLGGRLAIDAAPGAGTCVTITLPLGPGVVRQSSSEGAA